MRRSVAARRAELLADPYIREVLVRRPDLERVITATLWAYPHSKAATLRARKVTAYIALTGGIGLLMLHRGLRGRRLATRE